jgi:glycerol-3-phosphate dehydrogenase (NAD(P)+)
MLTRLKNVCFIGAGSIGTALGNALAAKEQLTVTLLSIEEDVVSTINKSGINQKYFPNQPLNRRLQATSDITVISRSDVIFLAIPSVATVRYLRMNKKYVNPDSIIVNLAKGFGEENKTITECLGTFLENPVCSLKGPTFARDIMNDQPTAFTLAARDEKLFDLFSEMFRDTFIHLDFTTDITGVEMLSILKNIYAIVLGIADAHFDSPNLRFLILTKAFREMKDILLVFGGSGDTLFNYCGYGDFSLTALNDLSRNRTLGLLIGKGFFSNEISDKVILEGKIAVNIFVDEINRIGKISDYPIIHELYMVFNDRYDISHFVNRILGLEN